MKKLFRSLFVFMFAVLLVGLTQVSAAGDAVSAIDGASIRVKTESSSQGLRFYAELDESVKDNKHGFYLVFGKTSIIELEDAIVEAGSGKVMLNGKEVFHVSIPGVKEDNQFSVVLTGIPDVGYFDELSAIAYVEVNGQKRFVEAPVTRSVANVVLKMANDGLDVSNVESIEAITQTAKKKVAVNAFGMLEVSGGLYEYNNFNLKEEFIKDWNKLFSKDVKDFDGESFFEAAKVGSEDSNNANKNLASTNLYKFFNDSALKDKWGWFLEYLLDEDGTTHATRQIEAVKGDGTNNEFTLYNGTHLAYSITNFFNQVHEEGGFTAINFTQLSRYDNVKNFNNKIFVNADNYEFYSEGESLNVPDAPAKKDGYNFEHYKIGSLTYNPGSLYAISGDALFEPVYKAITYSVKFYDGTEELTALAKTYNIETDLVLAPATKEGLTFRGWYDNALFEGEAITKINVGEMGDKEFYAKWSDSAVVKYNLGDYGYHTSTKTKEDLYADFVADYIQIFGRSGQVDAFMENFFNLSYIPTQYSFESIFTHENGKHEWVKNHIVGVAVATGYEGAADLLEYDQAAWRRNIEGFFKGEEIMAANVASIDFSMEKNSHNFWKHTDYGVYEEDFVAGGALFNSVKTDSKIYGFKGFVDKDGNLVTQLPNSIEGGELELFAKWERSAFYVTFNVAHDGDSPETQLVALNDTVTKPEDPTRLNHTFKGWYLNGDLYDFDSGVTSEVTLTAKWDEVAAGAEYTISYELDGGYIAHTTKTEMVNAFLEDFYAYLNLSSSMSDFKHGSGKSSGFDGQWHSVHKAKIYSGARPTAVDEAYFISSSKYMEKWLGFFDMVHDFIVEVNESQFFFGAGTQVGFIRLRQYVIHEKPAAFVTEEQMNKMPAEPIKADPITEGAVGLKIVLQKAYKQGKTFKGWYLNSDFSGDAVTELNPTSAENITLYAKFE